MFKVGSALYYSTAELYSILVVVNKHNIARVASCWFIIYYRLVMHGKSNVKKNALSVSPVLM